jgi:hypothetical protein
LPVCGELCAAGGDSLPETFEALALTVPLRGDGFVRLFVITEGVLALGMQLGAPRLGRARLRKGGAVLREPRARIVECALGALPGIEPGDDFARRPGKPGMFGVQPVTFFVERLPLLADCGQPRLEQIRRLARLLAQGTDFFLPEQIGQQRLDLRIRVGAQRALALRAEDGGKKCESAYLNIDNKAC